MQENVKFSVDDGIALIALNRPDRLNAFNHDLCSALNDAVAQASADEGIRVVVLTGEGRAFSSGADLKEGIGGDESLVERLNRDFLPAISGIRKMDKPVIAAVNGPVAGIGAAYLLACDLAVMDPGAYVLQPFINISLVPDGGITWELVRQLGHKRAYEFITGGEPMAPQQCRDLGLINRISQPGAALEEAMDWARQLLEKAPLALRYSKEALRVNAELAFRAGFQKEAELQEICAHSDDAREGITAFVEKREPKFEGR
ncbi:MAG: enoyl-CoA hydratase/isomerase family protein [Xanthomonadales bacterium]|nr:enoyl-CoA hydratase/isomerase family protein [Xanthomonadales bacterium]